MHYLSNRLWISLILFLLTESGLTQTPSFSYIDSLNTASEYCLYTLPNHSAELAKKAFRLSSRDTKFRNQKVFSLVNWSYALLEGGAVDSSSIIADSAKLSAVGISDSAVRSAVLVMQGYLCDYQEKNEEALHFYFEGLTLCPDLKHRAAICNNIGTVYKTMKDLENAEKYYRLSYEIGVQQNDLLRQSKCLNNLGGIFYSQKNYSAALDHYKRSLQIRTLLKDTVGTASSISNIAMVYQKQNKLDSALLLYRQTLVLGLQTKRPTDIVVARMNIGNLLFKMKDNKSALAEQHLAAILADSVRLHYYSRMAHRLLANSYAQTGNYKDAYENYVLYAIYNDTVVSESMVKKTKDLELRYQTRENAQQIKLLYQEKKASNLENENKANQIEKQRNLLWIALLVSIGIILLALLLFQRYRTERKYTNQLQQLVSEKDLLLREIHHRVKNNLQLVSSLLSLQEAHDEGSGAESLKQNQERIHTLSLLHEQLYRSTDLKAIGFRNYTLQLLEHISKSFSKPGAAIELNCDADDIPFDIDQLVPCGLILNELVTNCFKYAFPSNSGIINVELKVTGSNCLLSVSDNGVGMDTNLMNEKKTLGLRLVDGLCRQLHGKFEAKSAFGETRLAIIFPLKLNTN
jgi:two-component system, sensor histidine kinase PdtaS